MCDATSEVVRVSTSMYINGSSSKISVVLSPFFFFFFFFNFPPPRERGQRLCDIFLRSTTPYLLFRNRLSFMSSSPSQSNMIPPSFSLYIQYIVNIHWPLVVAFFYHPCQARAINNLHRGTESGSVLAKIPSPAVPAKRSILT